MAESTPQLLFAILLVLEAMDEDPNFPLNTSFYVNLSSLIISMLSVWNGLTKYAIYVKQQIGFIKYLQFFFATIVDLSVRATSLFTFIYYTYSYVEVRDRYISYESMVSLLPMIIQVPLTLTLLKMCKADLPHQNFRWLLFVTALTMLTTLPIHSGSPFKHRAITKVVPLIWIAPMNAVYIVYQNSPESFFLVIIEVVIIL